MEIRYRFVLGGLRAGPWQPYAGIDSKESATNGADNRNKLIRQCPGPRVNPPRGKNQPPALEADRLRAVASRIFFRRRSVFGVTSTYSSGAMYSSERSSVIWMGGAN